MLRVGGRAPEFVTIYGNKEVKHRIAIAPNGAFDESATKGGLLVLCTNQDSIENVPGRAIEIKLSGRPSIKKVKKGKGKGKKGDDDDDDDDGGKKGKKGKKEKKQPDDEECYALDGETTIAAE